MRSAGRISDYGSEVGFLANPSDQKGAGFFGCKKLFDCLNVFISASGYENSLDILACRRDSAVKSLAAEFHVGALGEYRFAANMKSVDVHRDGFPHSTDHYDFSHLKVS